MTSPDVGEAMLNLVDVRTWPDEAPRREHDDHRAGRAAAMRTRPGYYVSIAVPVTGTDAHDVYESGPVATPAEAMLLYGEAVHALVEDGTLVRVADAPWRVFAVDADGTRRELTKAEDAAVVAVIEQAADGRRIALRPPA
jgi:sulfur transfer complex TusBCD TusB component (DsrH family)